MNTQNKSCTCENRDMHRRRLEGKWVHTWATSHHTLSIEKVSAQFRNNRMYIREWGKSIMYDNQSKQSINQSQSHICRAPTKTHLFCMN